MRLLVFAESCLILVLFAEGQLKNYIGQGEMPIKGMQVHCIKSDTYVPIEKLRDGICNCDIPPHGCRNPNCSDCNDPSDEVCPENTFFCGPGKCVDIGLFLDGKLDCSWNCIETDVHNLCVNERRSFITEVQDLAVAALSNSTHKATLIQKCTATSKIHGLPLDCIAQKEQSSDCQYIQTFLDWCHTILGH